MAIAHINHVRQSTLTEYILQNFKYSVTEAIDLSQHRRTSLRSRSVSQTDATQMFV